MNSKDIKKQLESNPKSVFRIKVGHYSPQRSTYKFTGSSLRDATITHEPEHKRFKSQTVYFDRNTFEIKTNQPMVIRPQEILSVVHHDVDQHMQEQVESYKQYMENYNQQRATGNNPNT